MQIWHHLRYYCKVCTVTGAVPFPIKKRVMVGVGPPSPFFYKNLGVQSHPAVRGEIEHIVVSSQNVIWYRSRGEIEHLTGLKNRH